MIANDRAMVLFDGQCEFCRRSVRFLQSLDWFGRLQYLSARERESVAHLIPTLDPSNLLEAMHVVTPGRQRVYVGFPAIRWIAWQLPVMMAVAPLLYLPGVLPLGDRLYRWVAKNRFQLVPCTAGACEVQLPRKA